MGIIVPIVCPMCNSDVEYLLHVFFDCKFAIECWQKVGMVIDMRDIESAPRWLLSMLETGSRETILKIATVLWGIWFVRNKTVWENKPVPPGIAIDWSLKHIKEWREAVRKHRSVVFTTGVNNSREMAKWLPPDVGQYKLNVDASVFSGTNSYSIGMILRDHEGNFFEGMNMRIADSVTVLEAETVGVQEALSWTKELISKQITIESDALLVVNAIHKNVHNQLEVDIISDDCRQVLNARHNVRLVFVRKPANRAVRLMARVPCSLNGYNMFRSFPPNFL